MGKLNSYIAVHSVICRPPIGFHPVEAGTLNFDWTRAVNGSKDVARLQMTAQVKVLFA
jgi:hypothetical protein